MKTFARKVLFVCIFRFKELNHKTLHTLHPSQVKANQLNEMKKYSS